jgi:signal transduction histidine kinase
VRRPFTDRDEAVLTSLAAHAGSALQNARLFAAAKAASEQSHVLSTRLLEVQEAERRHLARELHDEVGPALSAVKINLQMLKRQPEMVGTAGRRVDDGLLIVDRLLQVVRQMSLDLRPSILDDLGLAAALRWYVGAQAERSGLSAEVVTEGVPDDLPGAIATTAFRIVQEAVTNVVRHASARRLQVRAALAGAQLDLVVADDGVGFDVAAARRQALAGRSLGLLGLSERAELAGGRTAVESAPGRGTTVRAWLPLSPAAPDPAARERIPT